MVVLAGYLCEFEMDADTSSPLMHLMRPTYLMKGMPEHSAAWSSAVIIRNQWLQRRGG